MEARSDLFWQKIRVVGACWEWAGFRDRKGYGCISKWAGTRHAHRYSYMLNVGPIPEGFQVDHLCRNPGCVNPRHLEAVTPRENVLRGVGLCAQNAKKTHCPQGHEYTSDNIYPRGNGRRCRKCMAEDARRYREKKRSAK